MKKAIYLTLALIILLSSLYSCNGKKPDESDKNIGNNDNNYNQNIEDDNGGESSDSENNLINPSESDYDGYCNIINLYKDLILYKNDGNDVSAFDLSGYTDISSEISSALKQIVFNNIHQLMGYAFKDINNDGTAELVLLDRNYNIFAIFTSVDQKAVLVDTFGVGNHTGAIDEKGTIYKSGYTKGETWCEKIMTLNESGELKEELKYGCIDYGGYYEDPQEAEYYKYVSGVKYSITKAELDGLSSQYSSVFSDTARITKDSGISFNAIMEIDPK